MFPRKQIKANARAALSANYWPVVGYPLLLGLLLEFILSIFFFVVILVSGVGAALTSVATGGNMDVMAAMSAFGVYFIAIIVAILFCNVIVVGQMYFYYKFYSGEQGGFGTFFEGFKDGKMLRIFGGMFLMGLFIYLWSLLLWIPGIIKSYSYRMVPFLLIDRPDLTIGECFEISKNATKGNKWGMFVLDLSFIGWIILTALTFGILGIFYVCPYMELSQAGVYDYLKRKYMSAPQQSSYDGPVYQSASYEGGSTSYEGSYTGESTSSQPSSLETKTESNDHLFDE